MSDFRIQQQLTRIEESVDHLHLAMEYMIKRLVVRTKKPRKRKKKVSPGQ